MPSSGEAGAHPRGRLLQAVLCRESLGSAACKPDGSHSTAASLLLSAHALDVGAGPGCWPQHTVRELERSLWLLR